MVDLKELGRIGVLAGGFSNEREISLESGRAVFNALNEMGIDVRFLDIKKEVTKDEVKSFDIDIAFIALHGRFGEDGTIQRILDEVGIPYTGSGSRASRLALDKIASREIFVKNGIDVPRYKVISKTQIDANLTQINADYLRKSACNLRKSALNLDFPVVVKPQFEGSSIGVSIVRDERELKNAAEIAFQYGDKILVEEYIEGRELTVGLLEDEPLPVIEIVARERFYNFKAKYKSADTKYIVPARVKERHYKEAQRLGRLAHRLLGCESFSRVDMLLDEKKDRIFVLEVNSIPGLTSHSLLPKAAASVGVGFNELCLKIIKSSLKKKGSVVVGEKI